MRAFQVAVLLVVALVAAGCSSPGAITQQSDAGIPPPTQDAATRAMPVVAARPARVFVFAGVGKKCEPIAEPELTITSPPAKGDISLKPGQITQIMSSAQGTCIGSKARGTGVYYTARAGQLGTDRFVVSAKLASGETTSRTFEVTIAE